MTSTLVRLSWCCFFFFSWKILCRSNLLWGLLERKHLLNCEVNTLHTMKYLKVHISSIPMYLKLNRYLINIFYQCHAFQINTLLWKVLLMQSLIGNHLQMKICFLYGSLTGETNSQGQAVCLSDGQQKVSWMTLWRLLSLEKITGNLPF